MSQRLDLRGLRCPIPVIRLEAAMRALPQGTTIEVLADDPIARVDLPHAARSAGFCCETLHSEDPTSFGFRVFSEGK
ncbi:sulfurtransferase TusA family protein [Parvularcula mediterranea]|uniref:sulfurtransferase TusA family protein n=1 Tax=Parvularcula mediterranea TaxID=2732508 RepID=UPI0018E99361